VLPGLPVRRRLAIEADERPVVEAVAFGALAGRHALPCPRRDLPKQGVGTLGGATEGDRVVAGDRQHIADLAGSSSARSLGLAP
jgi:hypothetical protein